LALILLIWLHPSFWIIVSWVWVTILGVIVFLKCEIYLYWEYLLQVENFSGHTPVAAGRYIYIYIVNFHGSRNSAFDYIVMAGQVIKNPIT
jgi:hypothetical protein